MFIAPTMNKLGTNGGFNLLNGSGLFDDFIKGNKSIGYSSGYTYFDILTSVMDFDEDNLMLPNGGLFPRIYSAVGVSGGGKSTTFIGLGGSIADRYVGGTLVYIDPEGNTSPERIRSLNGWSEYHYHQKCLYIPATPPKTINDVYNIIRRLAHIKAEAGEKSKIQTPFIDSVTGKHIKVFPPTVAVLDSLPALVISQIEGEIINAKKEYKDTEKIASNIDAMREAKDNTNFVKKVKGILMEYNIILIMINHITKEVPMSMFDRPKKNHPNLKAGEKLKGGAEVIYQSFGMFKQTPKELLNERNPIYGDDINGSINILEFIKNKSNVSGGEFRFVFDKRTGYRPELSDFEYLWNVKFGIKGSNRSLYLDILPEVTFSRKNLIKKCFQIPELSRAIHFQATYRLGNEFIMNGNGNIDMEKLGTIPYNERMSLLATMTAPYPGYINMDYFNNDAIAQNQINAFRGSLFTQMDPRDYISPLNFGVLQNIIDYSQPRIDDKLYPGYNFDPRAKPITPFDEVTKLKDGEYIF